MIRRIIIFFDKLEDNIRHRLSRHPVLYALIGGVGVVLFWKGVWDLADLVQIPALWSLAISVIILLLTGTFVSFFIGEQIILSGIRREKRIDEKTEEEVRHEEIELKHLERDMEKIKHQLADIKKIIESARL